MKKNNVIIIKMKWMWCNNNKMKIMKIMIKWKY